MKRLPQAYSWIAAVVALVISSGCSPTTHSESKENSPDKTTKDCQAAAEFKAQMRVLWEDHVTWTRNVILCLVDNLPGKDQAISRLLQNQKDIGNAVKPYYGDDAGKTLTELLNPHITIAAEVVTAAKAGNAKALDEANKRWNVNADEISRFLCNANPNWDLMEMKMMMDDHLKLTTDEAVQRIKKNYPADVVAYEKVHKEILKMSDMLADGIVQQFPEKFKTNPPR